VRRAHDDLWNAPLRWLETDDSLLMACERGAVVVAANLDEHEAHVELPPGSWTVAFSSRLDRRDNVPHTESLEVPAETALLLVRS
jgi:hypothetical protein